VFELPHDFWGKFCQQLRKFSFRLEQVCLQQIALYMGLGCSYGAGLETMVQEGETSIPFMSLGNAPLQAYQDFIRLGGRGFDTAISYGDHQRMIGVAIERSDFPREYFFVTSKIPCCPHDEFAAFFYERVCSRLSGISMRARALQAIENIGTEYLDMLLIHQPCNTTVQTIDAYKELESVVAKNSAIRSLGVSNFNSEFLLALVRQARIRPAVVQNGLNAISQTGTSGGIHAHGGDLGTLLMSEMLGIQYMAFSPLGGWSSGSTYDVLNSPTIVRVAQQLSVDPAQVALRWLVQQGVPFVTASSGNAAHLEQDLMVQNLSLADEDMAAIGMVAPLSKAV